jgi:hypothetical protein
MRVDLPNKKYDADGKIANFYQELESRIGSLPGVETVGLISELPLSGQPNDMPYTVEGRPQVSPDDGFDHDFRRVNSQYFRSLRIPLQRGRNFTEQEVRQGAKFCWLRAACQRSFLMRTNRQTVGDDERNALRDHRRCGRHPGSRTGIAAVGSDVHAGL